MVNLAGMYILTWAAGRGWLIVIVTNHRWPVPRIHWRRLRVMMPAIGALWGAPCKTEVRDMGSYPVYNAGIIKFHIKSWAPFGCKLTSRWSSADHLAKAVQTAKDFLWNLIITVLLEIISCQLSHSCMESLFRFAILYIAIIFCINVLSHIYSKDHP